MKNIHSKKPEECQYSFTQHKTCEFFPCHETEHPEDFNCLFCYCPLYTLGSHCGGNFVYLDSGVKDCSNCLAKSRPLSLRLAPLSYINMGRTFGISTLSCIA